MKFHYIVELTQVQSFFVSIEADSTVEAIELAIQNQGEVETPYPPELKSVTAKVVRNDYGKE